MSSSAKAGRLLVLDVSQRNYPKVPLWFGVFDIHMYITHVFVKMPFSDND